MVRPLLVVPLFPYTGWLGIKEVLTRWLKENLTIFVPLTIYKACIKRGRLKVIYRLDEVAKHLRDRVSMRVEEIRKLCLGAGLCRSEGLRLIFHTEYQCMIWNWNELLEVYPRAIINCVKTLQKYGIKVELVELEYHPGFIATSREGDTFTLSNSQVHSKDVINGMVMFTERIAKELNTEIRVTIENRGSSIFGNVPQIVHDVLMLKPLIEQLNYKLRERGLKIDVGFTADPWQENKYKPTDKTFGDIIKLIEQNVPLHDVHVHWNNHRVPPPEIMDKFVKIIEKGAQQSAKFFVTPEVLTKQEIKKKEIIQFSEVLENSISQPSAKAI